MRRRRAAAAALALLAGLSGGLPARGDAPDAGSGDDALDARLRQIEAAVRSGDVGALCAAATPRGRVRLQLPEARGSFGAGQLQVVLERVFEDLETRSFAFDGAAGRGGGATVLAPGTWVRRRRDGEGESHDTLTFALRVEQGHWRIVEIRSSP